MRYAGTRRVVCVTGDRWWNDLEAIRKVLAKEPKGTVLMQGGAPGADGLSELVALELGMPRVQVPYFGYYGRAGGPIRNSFMVAVLLGLQTQGWEVKVLAFHDNLGKSKGTKDMVTRCRKEGLDVRRFAHKK